MFLIALAAVVAAAPAPPPQLTLTDVLQRTRPAPEALATEVVLGDARRELALSRGILLEGLSLTAEAGPRRSPEGDDSDVALGVDLPLAADGEERRAAVQALERASRLLPEAAAIEAELAVRISYLDAWSAAEEASIRSRDVAAAERWLAAAERRVEAGADPPFEAALVAAEAAAARLELADARERARLAWGELAARTEIGDRPRPLAPPDAASSLSTALTAENLAHTTLTEALEAGSRLERALIALGAARDASRFSLGGSVAREGEEEVARLGVGYRLPLAGERAARAEARDAALAEFARRAEFDREQLAARIAAVRERATAAGTDDVLSADAIERALAALDARLAVGKDRPSEVLPARRQLFDALTTLVAARAARLRLTYELEALTREIEP